jgi:hypothetical protein
MLQPGNRRAPVTVFFPHMSSHRFKALGNPPIRPRAICPAPVTGAPPPSPALRRITAVAFILREGHPRVIPCRFGRPSLTLSPSSSCRTCRSRHRPPKDVVIIGMRCRAHLSPFHCCCAVSVSPRLIRVAWRYPLELLVLALQIPPPEHRRSGQPDRLACGPS